MWLYPSIYNYLSSKSVLYSKKAMIYTSIQKTQVSYLVYQYQGYKKKIQVNMVRLSGSQGQRSSNTTSRKGPINVSLVRSVEVDTMCVFLDIEVNVKCWYLDKPTERWTSLIHAICPKTNKKFNLTEDRMPVFNSCENITSHF